MSRSYSTADKFLANVDRVLRTVAGGSPGTGRANPAEGLPEADLDDGERTRAAGMMRVNHAGEIAAQALYHGQALTAREDSVRESLERAAEEENDHLLWCEKRVGELGSHTSLLAPFWYIGSLAIGCAAGAVGDRVSLGFIVETERQVVEHLEGHLARLPKQDLRSRAIVEQMREDEGRHATVALSEGGVELPNPVRQVMRRTAKVMTRLAYWI